MAEKEYHNKNGTNAQVKKEASAVKQIHFNVIDSTNSWAKAHTGHWASSGVTLVTASEQTAGRGRFKRKWISPAGVNVYATFCFWFDPKRKDIGHIPQLLAISAALALEKKGFSPQIKWPNDLLLQGKKVAGILCESIIEGEKRGVVCGIGLNVNMSEEDLASIDRPATSLFVEAGHSWNVDSFLRGMTEIFIGYLEEFMQKGFSPFFSILQERSSLKKGDAVHFQDYQSIIKANFEALHPDGSVELRLPNGTTKLFYVGEFVMI